MCRDMLVLRDGPAIRRMWEPGYMQSLYSSHGVREYWLVDSDAETVEVMAEGTQALLLHATHRRDESLTSPLLAGLAIDMEQVIRRD